MLMKWFLFSGEVLISQPLNTKLVLLIILSSNTNKIMPHPSKHWLLLLLLVLHVLLKLKWYLDKKWHLFRSFLVMVTFDNAFFCYLKSFLLISGVSGFSFITIEQIRKCGIHWNFYPFCFLMWDFSQAVFIYE